MLSNPGLAHDDRGLGVELVARERHPREDGGDEQVLLPLHHQGPG